MSGEPPRRPGAAARWAPPAPEPGPHSQTAAAGEQPSGVEPSPTPAAVDDERPLPSEERRRPHAARDDDLPLLPEERQQPAPLAPRRLRRSFGAAFAGLGHLLRHEPNAQIHTALAVVAAALGLWLGLTPPEWALLMALFGLVIGLEAINTAVEGLADLAMPRRDPRVATIKDVAAGGVLIAALAAAAAGLFLFGPRLLHLFGS
jgi:diacylglycerol kinase